MAPSKVVTPEAFKKCLMRAQRRKEQTVDPVVYCDYYLLLETTYNLYTYYEKEFLSKKLEKDQQIEETYFYFQNKIVLKY